MRLRTPCDAITVVFSMVTCSLWQIQCWQRQCSHVLVVFEIPSESISDLHCVSMKGDFRRISEKHGHKKLFGSHLDESTLQRTELMSWRGVFDRKWSGHFAARKAHPDLWEKISVASGTEENQAIQASSVLDALELQSDNGGSIWGWLFLRTVSCQQS